MLPYSIQCGLFPESYAIAFGTPLFFELLPLRIPSVNVANGMNEFPMVGHRSLGVAVRKLQSLPTFFEHLSFSVSLPVSEESNSSSNAIYIEFGLTFPRALLPLATSSLADKGNFRAYLIFT